jgi:hypothetical protein
MPLATSLAMPLAKLLVMTLAMPIAMSLPMPLTKPSGILVMLWRKRKKKITLVALLVACTLLDQTTHGIVYEIDTHIFHSNSLDISYALANFLAMAIL